MKIIGITGRSGCGKSSVTAYFADHGWPCVDADRTAREVLYPGSPCLAKLQARFGLDILEADGTLRRRLLADRAFATPAGTAALTAITHPEIFRRIEAQIQAAKDRGSPLVFVDGAVIVGTAFEKRCDLLILVTAPYEKSVERICKRDGIAPEMARRRLDAQTPEAQLRAAADIELVNDDTPQALQRKCGELLLRLQREAHETT